MCIWSREPTLFLLFISREWITMAMPWGAQISSKKYFYGTKEHSNPSAILLIVGNKVLIIIKVFCKVQNLVHRDFPKHIHMLTHTCTPRERCTHSPPPPHPPPHPHTHTQSCVNIDGTTTQSLQMETSATFLGQLVSLFGAPFNRSNTAGRSCCSLVLEIV